MGTSSEMTALAQPNQIPVPAGELSRVQSLTWVKEAAPANPATVSRMRTRTTPSTRVPRLVVGLVVISGLRDSRGSSRSGGGCSSP